MLCAIAGCRLWTLPVLDRPRRSARVSGPDPHTLRSAVGFQSVGIAPPTRVWRRILVRCLLWQVTSLPAQTWPFASQPATRPARLLHGLDLFKKKFKPIEFAVDDRFKMLREGAAVAGLELVQPLAPVAAQRLISGYALAEQKSFDTIDVSHSLGG